MKISWAPPPSRPPPRWNTWITNKLDPLDPQQVQSAVCSMFVVSFSKNPALTFDLWPPQTEAQSEGDLMARSAGRSRNLNPVFSYWDVKNTPSSWFFCSTQRPEMFLSFGFDLDRFRPQNRLWRGVFKKLQVTEIRQSGSTCSAPDLFNPSLKLWITESFPWWADRSKWRQL